MHILIIHQAFASFDEPGGTRHYELSRWLVANGHRVTVIASPVSYITGSRVVPPAASGPEAAPSGLQILRAAVYGGHHKSFMHRMWAFFTFMWSSFWLGLRVSGVDLVWGTSPPIFQGVTAWLLARLKRARFLFEVRDLWPQFAVDVGVLKSPVLIRLSEWLEHRLYRAADCVMVNSPGFLEHVRQRGARRIELVPNGADPAMFVPTADGTDFRRKNGLVDRFVALYAGAHGMSNDLEVVVDAAAQLQDTNIQIVFVGDGKEKPALQARAVALGLRNVTFLASVPKNEMPAVLAAADAGIAILKPIEAYKTTYPNKVFDYMAAAKPVILAIDGVIRQVVESAHAGLFVQPGSARALAQCIRSLAAEPALAREMGASGRIYLERNFSREQLAQKLLDVLQSTLAPRSSHAAGS